MTESPLRQHYQHSRFALTAAVPGGGAVVLGVQIPTSCSTSYFCRGRDVDDAAPSVTTTPCNRLRRKASQLPLME